MYKCCIFVSSTTTKPKAMNAKTYTRTINNTFAARESLKKAGFEFHSSTGTWDKADFDENEWKNKWCNPTYIGRKQAAINAAVKFETKVY